MTTFLTKILVASLPILFATAAGLAGPDTRPAPIKAGVIVSVHSAQDLNARRHEDGYKDQVEMVKALYQKPEVELFIVIDPGSAQQEEMAGILKKYVASDHVLDGAELKDLQKLDVIVSPRNYLPDSVFNAVVLAVKGGVGLLKTMQIGRENQGADFAAGPAEELLGIGGAEYYWPNREVAASVVADHPIVREFTARHITTIRARPNGYLGRIPGTPLITAEIEAADGKKSNYCFLYAAEMGKGKIVVGQWLRIPPDIVRITKGRFYIHCLQWLANQPIA